VEVLGIPVTIDTTDEFRRPALSKWQGMGAATSKPVVHLELHTGDLQHAGAFFARLCGWRQEQIDTRYGSYRALELGRGLGGGMVECGIPRALWLPYVEVPDVAAATERARLAGASVLLEPREGPAGRRSVVASPASGEIAFWQHKR
jgi:predicted enzyme related to lactoylglutathione lyase